MRCMKFSNDVVDALEAAGFEVVGDKESACFAALDDELRIEIIQPEGMPNYWVYVTLPSGSTLRCTASVREILRMAGGEADDNEAA